MIRILANDGIAADGKELLVNAGFEVVTDKIEQNDLPAHVGEFDVLVVRSATKVTADVVANPGKLKLIIRAGVGIDNIDVPAAEAKGIEVRNTPNSSTISVAEIAIAHLMSIARYLHQSNREMFEVSDKEIFKNLKKEYSNGVELRGKTLGVIGFGRIGQETAKLALGLGLNVMVYNRTAKKVDLELDHIPVNPTPVVSIETMSLEAVLRGSDYLTLHTAATEGYLLGRNELELTKKGCIIINTARGGVIDEKALVELTDAGHIMGAGIDVFEGEPVVQPLVASNKNFSLTPHTASSSIEAQAKVSQEVAELIISKMKVTA